MANRWVALALVFLTRTSMDLQFRSVASVTPLMITDVVGDPAAPIVFAGAVMAATVVGSATFRWIELA